MKSINDKENSDLFFKEKETITISKEKKIDIYNNFIIIDKFIFHLFIKNKFISNNRNIKSVKHIYGNNKNIILIEDVNQKIILFGNIMNENLFKLEYIFDYNQKSNIQKEITEMIIDYNCYLEKNYVLMINLRMIIFHQYTIYMIKSVLVLNGIMK